MDFHTDFKPVTIQPDEIENLSYSTVAKEIGEHPFSPEQFAVVQRVIYTTADFELGRSVVFHPLAVQAGVNAILNGKKIITDVQMIQVGINKTRLKKFGIEPEVYINDPDVAAEAKRLNITRAMVAVRKVVKEAEGGIFAIGNAPTAVLELIRLIKEGIAKPALVVAFPVGFVSAAESKEELAKLDVPFITNVGRKGGSTVTVAAINALAMMAEKMV
jgi:precorrin-8X/cobalt-precorrin-8 methylmutase